MRHECEGYAENVDVFSAEEAGSFIDVIVGAAEATAYDLLAEKLRGEGAQAHDVSNGLGIPAFRKHTDGNDGLNPFSGLADLANRVDGLTKLLGALLLG